MMKTLSKIIIVLLCHAVLSQTVCALGSETFLRDDFDSLDSWKPLYFRKISKHSEYSIVSENGQRYLKAESRSSASGIVYKSDFNIYDYPNLKWRWKISNTYKKGDAETKEGDDYPARIYVMFKYDPEHASFGKRIKYGLAKKIYGEYPPHSTLNYIWANKDHTGRILTNTYADQAKMIILQTGDKNAGKWIEQKVNVLQDYRDAFGENPPETAKIAIMNDSDNTGESSVSFVDYIEVYK